MISFPIYLWHYPLFFAADRWAKDMQWLPRALLTIAALAAIVTITQLAIERPVGRWLDRNRRETEVVTHPAASPAAG